MEINRKKSKGKSSFGNFIKFGKGVKNDDASPSLPKDPKHNNQGVRHEYCDQQAVIHSTEGTIRVSPDRKHFALYYPEDPKEDPSVPPWMSPPQYYNEDPSSKSSSYYFAEDPTSPKEYPKVESSSYAQLHNSSENWRYSNKK